MVPSLPKPHLKLSKITLTLLALLFFLVLTGIRLVWNYELRIPDHPSAVGGIQNFQEWNFDDKQTITLDGEWEFYPGVFLEKGDSKPDLAKQLIQVPGTWDKSTGTGSALGYGTYHLKILIRDTSKTYAIRIPNVYTASRLFINGTMKAETGHAAVTEGDNQPRNVPYYVSFRTSKPELDIALQVSNFQISNLGGIIQSVTFGTGTAVSKEAFFSENLQYIVCIVLILHGLYALILYFLGVRGKGVLLFLGIILSVLTAILVDDDKMLLTWLPLNLEISTKLKILSYMGISVFLFFWIKVFTQTRSSWFTRGFAWISLVFSIIVILSPMSILRQAGLLFLLIMMLTTVVAEIKFFVRAIYQGERAILFLLLSTIAIKTNIVWGSVKTHFWHDMLFYPIDLIVAFLGLAAYWFVRFFQTTAQAAMLARQLEHADKVKDDFLANTSHELRNPLHGIINMAQSVIDVSSKDLGAEEIRSLEQMISTGRRMTFQLNDLLDAARLKEQQIILHKRSISFTAVATGVIDLLRTSVANNQEAVNHGEIILDVPEHFPYVIADENRLIQIVFDLLQEAGKVSMNGHIVLRAEVVDGIGRFSIWTSCAKFEDGSESHDSEYGLVHEELRLAICRQLVELHGGSFTIKTTSERDRVFTFTLRLNFNKLESHECSGIGAEEEATIKDHPEDVSQFGILDLTAAGSEKPIPKILAVDDDPVNLAILCNILPENQYQLVTVASAREAVELLDHRDWDLVISDVMMPQMSGYELTRIIRQKFSISELPVLLLTARSQRGDIQTAFLAGANDYLTKPVGSTELKSRVHALYDLKRSVTERLRMEAAWLQAQIQPHFLFNTLNTIASLSEVDTERMLNLLEEFGKYLKSSFDARNLQKVVPIEHELGLLRSYLYIEKERFGERLQIIWKIPNPVSVLIPPLSIQPLAENAVRHGILKRSVGGTLTIQILENPTEIEISIKDDGVGMDHATLQRLLSNVPDPERGVGVQNTNRRLIQLYGLGLQISSIPDQGTTVRFVIPKMTEAHK